MEFAEFQKMNVERCRSRFRNEKDWSPQIWALAIAGEAGELCNILKKVYRGDFPIEQVREDVLNEIADVITYCDLLMSAMDEDTETRLVKKFTEVSKRQIKSF